MTGEKLEAMAWKQLQAVDALCVMLDALEREARTVTQGPAAAETFVGRLRVYMGAFHLITDTLEDSWRIWAKPWKPWPNRWAEGLLAGDCEKFNNLWMGRGIVPLVLFVQSLLLDRGKVQPKA